MKFQKSFLLLFILFASFQAAVGQEKPEALLYDRMSWSGCESIMLRLQNFAIHLNQHPDSKGFIVIYGKKNDTLRNPRFEEVLKTAIDFWKFDKDRFTFAHGEDKEGLLAEFWEVPAGAKIPAYAASNWSYMIDLKKPYMFDQDYIGQGGICEVPLGTELYSKFLLANPNLRGNIVIYETSAAKFRIAEKKLLNELLREHKVARNRLKTFYVKNYPYAGGIELWLVPRKKK